MTEHVRHILSRLGPARAPRYVAEHIEHVTRRIAGQLVSALAEAESTQRGIPDWQRAAAWADAERLYAALEQDSYELDAMEVFIADMQEVAS